MTENNQDQKQEAVNDVPTAEVPTPIGESQEAQQPPLSIVARERMIEIIANNKKVMADCEAVLEILNSRPELDGSFCRLFGITKTPGVRDIR